MNLQLKQKTIFDDNFLLLSDTAIGLYHDYAKNLPIIDYHNHLSPIEIASNRKFNTLTEIWLKGDHYKWRAMRAYGIEEKYITGDATDEAKFHAWAKVVPYTLRNPLFHWTHMELKNPFRIDAYLNTNSASYIYSFCNDLLQQEDFSSRSLLKKFNVEMLGTTDDPCDLLLEHQQLKAEQKEIVVLPSFRPDKIFNITDQTSWLNYISKLSEVSGINISDVSSLLAALKQRIQYFHEHDCRVSDHGLNEMPSINQLSVSQEAEIKSIINGRSSAAFSDPEALTGFLLFELCKMYHEKGWVQQFHLGAIRSVNTRMLKLTGPETGFDSIGDFKHAKRLVFFLDELDKTDQLSKTIIYNLNPADNEVFATMIGNYNTGGIKGKIQFGSAWWFLDQKDGIEKQLNALSNFGLLSTSIGMLTDSRSFLSYSRHEYFRRILCNLFAEEIESGQLPNDRNWIGGIIRDICYFNVKNYLGFDKENF
ncbi:glucuronate isomerase [Mucilaginibacter sp. UYCu711]|uniref:glucuronate isomerase n=1 Tax=Mucilaginibacter sp. UYCu711 TaxID=3156339 RepID=UPI003D1EA68D